MSEWRIAFWLTFSMLAMATVVYAIAASGDVQKWNNLNDSEKVTKSKVSEKSDA